MSAVLVSPVLKLCHFDLACEEGLHILFAERHFVRSRELLS